MGARRRNQSKDNSPYGMARSEKRTIITELYLRGLTQDEIAKEVGLDQPRVSNHLAKVRAEWVAKRDSDITVVIGRELERIDLIERHAWQAWERSKKIRRKNATETGRLGVKVTHAKEEMLGDPRFLERVSWCVEARCKILGLMSIKRKEAPTQEEVTDRLARILGLSTDAVKQSIAVIAPPNGTGGSNGSGSTKSEMN